MKRIETNISDSVFVHDAIMYPPIEKQVYDLFADKFASVKHETDRDGLSLLLDGTRCCVEIGIGKKKKNKSVTNGVRVSIIPPYSHDGIRFGERDYPSVKLVYNTDVADKVDKFCNIIRNLQVLEEKAKALSAIPDKAEIEKFLNHELATDLVRVSYWSEPLFSGLEISFNIHPKGSAPADGIFVCLEKGTNKITPFWNGSTERRKGHASEETIERAVGRQEKGDLASMKARIRAIEKVKEKVDAFDVTKSPELMQLLKVKGMADDLLKEFESLTKVKK